MQSIGGWQFGFGSSSSSSSSSSNKDRPIRVLLLGQPGVGKTAIAVRFASRRFIGEYDSSVERLYRFDNQIASWELADPPGDEHRRRTSADERHRHRRVVAPIISESRLRWADAVVMVYSVTDRVSFEEIWRLRFLLNQALNRKANSKHQTSSSSSSSPAVVVLVGNKTDLCDCGPDGPGERMVTTAEGRRRAVDIEAQDFYEISARESFEQVMAVFASTARLVHLLRPPATPTSSLQAQASEQASASSSFRLRASTDSSIIMDARRRPLQAQQHSLFKRRLSISARGSLH